MIRVLDTTRALEELAPEWDALWRRTPGATPFQSPAWLLPWWHHFGTPLPLVAVSRQSGLLTGVMPMYVLEEPGVCKLLPIGAGITDYLDVLGGPADGLLAAVLDSAREARVDLCDLIEVPPESALRTAPPPQGWDSEWYAGSICPVLPLPPPVSGMRRKLAMSRNRAARQGGFVVETAGPDSLTELLHELIRLHQARWATRGEPGVLVDPAVIAFHQEAAPLLLAQGVLRLQALRAEGRIVAVILALLAGRDRILTYLSGFDSAASFISPGTILLGHLLDQAVREGRQEAHFLRGQESYKYAWGACDRVNFGRTLVLQRPSQKQGER